MLDAISTLRFEIFVLKRYHIFHWNGEDGFSGEGFHKSANRYSANILRGVLQNCWREFLKIQGGDMEKYLEMISKKYCEVFCKTTVVCSGKLTKIILKTLLKGLLQNFWKVFCKNIRRCSAKILKGDLQNCWGEFYTPLSKNEKLPCKNSPSKQTASFQRL